MEKQETPKWLIDGAYSKWYSQANFASKVLIWSLILGFIFCMTLGNFGTIIFGQPGFLLGIIIGMVLFYTVGYFSLKKVEKYFEQKKGNDTEWQKKYLQSKIDEALQYQSMAPKLISDINEKAIQKISEINVNLEEMLKKKTEAEKVLLELQT